MGLASWSAHLSAVARLSAYLCGAALLWGLRHRKVRETVRVHPVRYDGERISRALSDGALIDAIVRRFISSPNEWYGSLCKHDPVAPSTRATPLTGRWHRASPPEKSKVCPASSSQYDSSWRPTGTSEPLNTPLNTRRRV